MFVQSRKCTSKWLCEFKCANGCFHTFHLNGLSGGCGYCGLYDGGGGGGGGVVGVGVGGDGNEYQCPGIGQSFIISAFSAIKEMCDEPTDGQTLS